MIIIKTKPSWNKETNEDIFGNSAHPTADYVHPLSRKGADSRDNMQVLSIDSNLEKSDKKKGMINDIRYSFQSYLNKSQEFIGTMYIQNHECDPANDEWIRVEKVMF